MNLILICGSISGFVKRINMMKESMIETEVTYSFEQDGKFFLIEWVPARVCSETGEQ
jgi:YgiT-type zinc finger domain-containing protein